ncbi:MAG: MaoC family dehydratase [Gammaproteobacteria bacterium]
MNEFSTDINDRYFEDYPVGGVFEFGTIEVSEEEIIEFAKRYDPQDFHVDPIAARETVFGGIIASGWHTGSLTMRLYADHYLSKVASLASPGLDELRWVKPVRPSDTLSVRVTVEEARRSRSSPDRGILRSFIETLNQKGEVVMTMRAVNFLRCRN